MTIEFAPYFHPTQIVLVDDDINFLGNLSLQLDADLAYLLFDSTHKALGYLEQSRSAAASCNRLLRKASVGPEGVCRDMEIDMAALHRKMQSANRFSQVSVVMVDYAMPEMNGLDFCRQITDPNIKKILFTGVATESVAVEAFNDGLIDHYIGKHEHAVYERLNDTIRQLQHDYVCDMFVSAGNVLSLTLPWMVRERSIGNLLDDLRSRQGLVEYYITDEPPGFLFANGQGQVKRVVIFGPTEREKSAHELAAAGAPSTLVLEVKQGRKIVDPTMATFCSSTDTSDETAWHAAASSTHRVSNQDSTLCWALFDSVGVDTPAQLSPSYESFLEWLDTMGYSMM